MSASRQKKLRQQQQQNAAANAPEQKKGMSKGLKKFLCVVIAIALIAAIVYLAMIVFDFFPAHSTAATVGDRDLPAAEVNYWLSDTYAEEQSYMSYLIDTDKPLNEQEYPEEGFDTWYDYMLDLALSKAASTYAVYDEAVAAGMSLSEEGQTNIDAQLESMDTYAPLYGFANADALIAANYGKGCDMDNYEDYLVVNTLAQEYITSKYAEAEYTEEELNEYYNAHADDVDMVSFRVFELFAETTEGEDGNSVVTEEALDAAEAAAIAMADAAKGDEAKFLELAVENTAEELRESYDPNANTLAPNVVKSEAPELFREWISDSSRTFGDVTIAENEDATGFYVVFFTGAVDMDINLPSVRHILVTPEKDEEGNISEEAWAAAEAQANSLLDEYLTGEELTEEAFGALADANSADTGSTGNGGLYENVTPGQMVEPFDAWCFDASRAAGDTGVVKTTYGYHVMYFCGLSEETYHDLAVTNVKRNGDYTEWESTIEESVSYKLVDAKYITVF